MMSRILAFDPGEKKIGYAVLERVSPSCLALNVLGTGKIPYKNNEAKVSQEIQKLVELYQPTALAFENSGQFLKGIYQPIIQQAIANFQIPAISIKVSEARRTVFGNADTSKAQTNYTIKTKIPLLRDGISKDEIDAITICLAALEMDVIQRENEPPCNPPLNTLGQPLQSS